MMDTHSNDEVRRLLERIWTPELVRSLNELRSRHPQASFEIAGVEIALEQAILHLATLLMKPDTHEQAA